MFANIWCLLSSNILLRGNITPFLAERFHDCPLVLPGGGTDLLGHLQTFLLWLQPGHQLRDGPTSPPGLELTGLLRFVLHHSLHHLLALGAALCYTLSLIMEDGGPMEAEFQFILSKICVSMCFALPSHLSEPTASWCAQLSGLLPAL